MDMMLVCIEGGQSLDQAMARVGQEMETSSGPLAQEFALVSHEFRAGKDRITVLRDFEMLPVSLRKAWLMRRA